LPLQNFSDINNFLKILLNQGLTERINAVAATIAGLAAHLAANGFSIAGIDFNTPCPA
jgi:hypothetical protein